MFRENFNILTARAHILSRLLQQHWDIRMSLSDLPAAPVWHINTTSFDTGKNWRFTRDSMGDWQFGTHYSPSFELSDAIAASAAVPYVIGALKLALPAHGWWQTDPATKRPIRKVDPPSRTVRLWDGGAYENMALEPLFKPTDGLKGCDFLICSDASGPLGKPTDLVSNLIAGRLASPRLFDIAADQIRALRSRMLINAIRRNEIKGSLFRIGTSARQLGLAAEAAQVFLSDEDCLSCLNYPTNLTQMTEVSFDRIARHGAEVAQLTTSAYADPANSSASLSPLVNGQ
jgi:NTE family protein